MKRLLTVCLGAALVILVGCELAPPGSTPGGGADQISQEQLKLLGDIRAIQQQTGQTVQTLLQEAQQSEELARAEQGLPAIVEDIAATQTVISDAAEAAQLQQAENARAALNRLQDLCMTMLIELPSSQVAQHGERALAYLDLSNPRLAEASAELTAAYDVTVRAADPAGVQALIEQAKSHLTTSDAYGASQVINTIIGKASAEDTGALLRRMLDGVSGAQDALDRQSWPVVQAELLEVRKMLDDLSGRVHFKEKMSVVEPPAATGGETPAAEGAPAAPTTPGVPAPAGTAPAATPPAATGQPPAAVAPAAPAVPPAAAGAPAAAGTPATGAAPTQ